MFPGFTGLAAVAGAIVLFVVYYLYLA